MAYLGNSLSIQQYAPTVSYLSGNGSTTAFTLPIAVVSASQIIVAVENVIQNPATAFSVNGTTLTFTSAPPSGTNNIWVEYTSLQTNTVAPSQGTVQNSSFGNLTSIPFAVGGPIGAGNASIMKNRIINGAMVVNQRSYNGTPTTLYNTYTLDRWNTLYSVGSKFSVSQSSSAPAGFVNSALITSLSAYTPAAGETYSFLQAIEGYNIADLGYGTANAKATTLSFWVQSSLTGSFGAAIQCGSGSYPFLYTISSANTWTFITVNIPANTAYAPTSTTNGSGLTINFSMGAASNVIGTAGSWQGSTYYGATGQVNLVSTNGATIQWTGVQLEVGSSATGFEYRQYQQELALCQRYYQVTGANWNINPVSTYITSMFPVQLRATPTAVCAGAGYTFAGDKTNIVEYQTSRGNASVTYSAEL